MDALEELLASLGLDDAPVFAGYIREMVEEGAQEEGGLDGAVAGAVEYVGEMVGVAPEDGTLSGLGEELRRQWEASRAAAQEADSEVASSAAEALQTVMRESMRTEEAAEGPGKAPRAVDEEVRAATLALASQSGRGASGKDEDEAAELGPRIDNRQGAKTGVSAEVKKRADDRRESINASRELRKAKQAEELKKKAHRMNMSEAKLKTEMRQKEGRAARVKAEKDASVRRKNA